MKRLVAGGAGFIDSVLVRHIRQNTYAEDMLADRFA
jgi:dTDP-D-glucose 4,6-dehydratase